MKKKQSLLRRMLTARGRSLDITRAGWLFIVLTLAVGFAAINSGSNLLHAIFGAQMALIIGSGVLSERTVRRAEALRLPARVAWCTTIGSEYQIGVSFKPLDASRASYLQLFLKYLGDDKPAKQPRVKPSVDDQFG